MDYLLKIISNPIFTTIITGTSVFVISQFFLELVLKPRIELKKIKAELSQKLLEYSSKYQNQNLDEKQINEIKFISSKLLSQAWIVYILKKNKQRYLEISHSINTILYGSIDKKNITPQKIGEEIDKIKKLDKDIKITYE